MTEGTSELARDNQGGVASAQHRLPWNLEFHGPANMVYLYPILHGFNI